MNLFLVTCGDRGFDDEVYGVFTMWAKAYDYALTVPCATKIEVYEADNPAAGSGYYWVTIKGEWRNGTYTYYDSLTPNPKYNRNTIASITHKEL